MLRSNGVFGQSAVAAASVRLRSQVAKPDAAIERHPAIIKRGRGRGKRDGGHVSGMGQQTGSYPQLGRERSFTHSVAAPLSTWMVSTLLKLSFRLVFMPIAWFADGVDSPILRESRCGPSSPEAELCPSADRLAVVCQCGVCSCQSDLVQANPSSYRGGKYVLAALITGISRHGVAACWFLFPACCISSPARFWPTSTRQQTGYSATHPRHTTAKRSTTAKGCLC